MKKQVLHLLEELRKINWIRRIIIKMLVKAHNFSYHWISFFSSFSGIHPKHKLTDFHKFFHDNIDSQDSVLDIGCGKGILTYDIAKKAKKVTGIDISKNNIDIAREKSKKNNLEFILIDALKFNPVEKYNVIILSNLLEHIDKRVEFLNKIKGFAPKILIRVPLVTRDWISLYKKEGGFEYLMDNSHFIEYTEKEFEDEIKAANLTLENYYVRFGELYAIIKNNI